MPMVKIAVDAMGGDLAPGAVVEGAIAAAREMPVEIFLVGKKDLVERELAHARFTLSSLHIVQASESIGMDESLSTAVRKKDSSMKVAFELMRRGEVEAVLSAGNSGALMATGMFVLGNLPGVERPAILVVIPTFGKGTVIIDAGANVDCKPRHLLQFGLMGSIYAERVLGISRPRVGVLSNGEEEGKGNELTRAASAELSTAPLNFIGYVEGRDICNGRVDVVVCDGFTGNVTLKTMEGLASLIAGVLKEAFQRNLQSRIGYLLSKRSLRQAYRRLDYAEYGGAPLLGLNGVAIIAHGGSGPRAIRNAIRVAQETVSHDVNRRVIDILGGTAETGDGKAEKFPRRIWQKIKSTVETLSDESGAKGKAGKGERKG